MHYQLGQTWKRKNSPVYVLSCVCCAIFCGFFINVSGIEWDVVECEVNLNFWYDRKQGKSHFLGNHSPLGNMVLSVICSLCNLVHLVIVQPTLPLWLTLNVNLKFVSITNMSAEGKCKRNIVLELYFVSSRNVCDLGSLDVPSARKFAHFIRESKASSYGSKISDLEYSTPAWENAIVKLICLRGLPVTPKPTMRENPYF